MQCACGTTLSVPKLSQLRELSRAEEAPPAPADSGWGFAQGALSAALLAAALLLGVAGYLYWTEPPRPTPFDPAIYNQNATAQIESAPPAVLFSVWHSRYLPLAGVGLSPMDHPEVRLAEQQIAQSRQYELWLLVAAGVTAGLAIAGYVMGRPKK